LALATVLGVGYVPFASGTFGSAAGLLVWAALPASNMARGIAVLAVFVAGTWSASVAERYFGRTDPGQVVIDEVLGMMMTLMWNPVGWRGMVIAFLLFRIADIIKPFPANRLEQLHGGLGIMADDAMAAVYANLALQILRGLAHVVPGLFSR